MKATPEDVAKLGIVACQVPHGRWASMKATPEDVAKSYKHPERDHMTTPPQ